MKWSIMAEIGIVYHFHNFPNLWNQGVFSQGVFKTVTLPWVTA